MKNKNHLKLTSNIIDQYDENFKKNLKINTFYGKNVYVSQNIHPRIRRVYQMFGDLGGTSMNGWPDDKKFTHIFIISEKDYNGLKNGELSEDVLFIESLINKQQTKKANKEGTLSSKIKIVKFESFKKYCEVRKAGKFQQWNKTEEFDFQKEIFSHFHKE